MKCEVPAASPAAQHDQGKSLDGSAISAHDKTTVPPSPASPGTTGDTQSAPAKENQHTVDVDVLAREIGLTGVEANSRSALLPLPQAAETTPEEAAERENIRREIQEKMAAMRGRTQRPGPVVRATTSQAPVVLSAHVPTQFRQPMTADMQSRLAKQPASVGSATSARDRDAVWNSLLSDLQLLDKRPSQQERAVGEEELNRSRALNSSRGSVDKLGRMLNSANDMSGASSLLSSRSPSPDGMLDNPISAAAKRETLLGSSMSSDYGSESIRDGARMTYRGEADSAMSMLRARGVSSLHSSNSSNDNYDTRLNISSVRPQRAIPDIGTNWEQHQRPYMSSNALPYAVTGQPASYTQALIQKQYPARAKHQQVEPAKPKSKTEAPTNLNVRCSVDKSGATVHVAWTPVWGAWAEAVRDQVVTFEVQMIVRWMPEQTWNNVKTVTEAFCTVNGLKPSYPFAVRVRATTGIWTSDYTQPVEFVTEPSPGQKREAQQHTKPAVVPPLQGGPFSFSKPEMPRATNPVVLSVPTYLERLNLARRDRDSPSVHTAPLVRKVSPVKGAAPDPSEVENTAGLPRVLNIPSNARGPTSATSGGPQVRRITLDDPENPHYAFFQQNLASAQPQPSSGAETSRLYGSLRISTTPSTKDLYGSNRVSTGSQNHIAYAQKAAPAPKEVSPLAGSPSVSSNGSFTGRRAVA